MKKDREEHDTWKIYLDNSSGIGGDRSQLATSVHCWIDIDEEGWSQHLDKLGRGELGEYRYWMQRDPENISKHIKGDLSKFEEGIGMESFLESYYEAVRYIKEYTEKCISQKDNDGLHRLAELMKKAKLPSTNDADISHAYMLAAQGDSTNPIPMIEIKKCYENCNKVVGKRKYMEDDSLSKAIRRFTDKNGLPRPS